MATGNLVPLSQQALVDCSWGFGNNGCDGGEDFRVYQFMMKHGGIPTADSYGGYLGADGFCHMSDPDVIIGMQIEVNQQVTRLMLTVFCLSVFTLYAISSIEDSGLVTCVIFT